MLATMRMPDLSTISASVTILRWLVPPGTAVRRGEPLLEVETDKAVMTIESTLTGVLMSTSAEPGQDVPASQPIATFEVDRVDEVPDAPPPTISPAQPSSPAKPAPATRSGSLFARNRQAAQPEPGPAEGES